MDRAVGPSWCSRIVTQRPSSALEHLDVLGYLLVASTVISLSYDVFHQSPHRRAGGGARALAVQHAPQFDPTGEDRMTPDPHRRPRAVCLNAQASNQPFDAHRGDRDEPL